MIDTLQILRALNHKTFTSGAQIAQQLGISRACVSQALKRAENYHVQLERRVGVGYRLSREIDWLDTEKVKGLLGELATHYSLALASYVSSTNKILMNDNLASDGQVLAAEWQNQGKGRLGRNWQGAVGGSLMFSVKKVFPQGVVGLSGLSLAVGVAIIRALKHVGVQGAALKWPNDVVCFAGKLGGILTEVRGDALGPSEIVIGIGLNCVLPDQFKATQTYADFQALGLKQDRNTLWAALLTSLYKVLNQFEKEGLAPFVAEWEAAHLWQNQRVDIIHGQQVKASGQAVGITPQGALRLMIDGQEKIFFSGDISLRRPS
jgi:BirA family biotin operon repressor/biotin-[acetyl-CoA-carboxylase] ligase